MKGKPTASWERDSESPRLHIGLARGALAIVFAAAIALGTACGGDEPDTGAADSSASQTAATAAPAESSNETAATAAPSETPATAETTLSANNASIAELAAAFEAAGISNARRWAREVDEYRPYDVDDTDYRKLRGELAKYNPAAGVVDAIIAQLHLP